MTTTLQTLLHARLTGDIRAANAVIDVVGGRVRILFGDVGDNPRIVLGVEDNAVKILYPTDLPNPESDDDDQGSADSAQDDQRGPQAGGRTQEREHLDPSKYKRPELAEMAEAAGIDITDAMTKADIADALNKHTNP